MWTPSKYLFKKIRAFESRTVEFKLTDSTKVPAKFSSTCSCTSPTFDPETGILEVTYKAKFPSKKEGPIHQTTQTVTVYYEDKTVDKLYIQANVYR